MGEIAGSQSYQWPLLIGWLILARHIYSRSRKLELPATLSTERPAHERTENLGRHDVLVWKHLDAVVQERSAPTIERPPLPAMDIKAGVREKRATLVNEGRVVN